jgi:predicted  nucleic acid-binding Zn-ribbon protein
MQRKKTHEEYEEELFQREIDFIPLEKYIRRDIAMKHECINGHIWNVTPNNVLNGQGCPQCFREKVTKTHEDYIDQLINIDSPYVPIEKYINTGSKILHECPVGHQWMSTPNNILKGYGCPECNHVGGYNKTRFSRDRELANSAGIMYCIVLVNSKTSERTCVKIGITKGSSNKDVLKRARGFKGYEPRIQKLVHGTLEEVFELEQSLHKKWASYRYLDSHRFGGHTELFQISKLPEILKSIPAEL